MELTTFNKENTRFHPLFMMSKIQNLNGTHNRYKVENYYLSVVYEVKDTKFEWNSQHVQFHPVDLLVVYDVKDTKFEWNSQLNNVQTTVTKCCL